MVLDREQVDDRHFCSALSTAQADTFVMRLPEGVDTLLGERGTSLSGGQRQRLTLGPRSGGQPAPADPRRRDQRGRSRGSRPRILSSLRTSAASTSVLVVAYRRATIALADEVIYLEHGRVLAHGTHEQLLSTVEGYRNLVTAYEKADAEREREHVYDEDVLVDEVAA